MFLDLPGVILLQVKATIDAFGKCWLHGDGNMYDNDADSNFRKDFSNPRTDNGDPAASYRVLFTNVNQVPETTEELRTMFLASKSKELSDKGNPTEVITQKIIHVDKYLPKNAAAQKAEDGKDMEIERLKAELAALKKTPEQIEEEQFQEELKAEEAKTKKK